MNIVIVYIIFRISFMYSILYLKVLWYCILVVDKLRIRREEFRMKSEVK